MIIYPSRSPLSSAPQQRTEETFICLLPISVSIHPDFLCKKFIRAMACVVIVRQYNIVIKSMKLWNQTNLFPLPFARCVDFGQIT